MSSLAFRNVDASPTDPVPEWPLEAIQTALERGGLSHWRLLADEIRAQPWGPVARRVEEVLGYSRPYGVSEAMERVIELARQEAEARERQEVASEIDGLVRGSGLSRSEFASHRHLPLAAVHLRHRPGDPVGGAVGPDAGRGVRSTGPTL